MAKPRMSGRDVLLAFLPSRAVSTTSMRLIAAVWAVLALTTWLLSPFRVLPTPMEVFRALGGLWSQQGLGGELVTSIDLNVRAVALTAVIAMLLSYLTVIPAVRPLVAGISKGRFLGLTGLTLIFTLMVGGGRPLKLTLLVFGMTVFFVTSMADEVANIPRERFDHARTMRMGEWRVVWEVVVLGTADRAFDVLRQNAAIGWMMLTMVEGISRSEGGVGAMLLNQNKHFHIAEVFAIQLMILFLGLVQDYAIGVVKRFLLPYAHLTLERS